MPIRVKLACGTPGHLLSSGTRTWSEEIQARLDVVASKSQLRYDIDTKGCLSVLDDDMGVKKT